MVGAVEFVRSAQSVPKIGKVKKARTMREIQIWRREPKQPQYGGVPSGLRYGRAHIRVRTARRIEGPLFPSGGLVVTASSFHQEEGHCAGVAVSRYVGSGNRTVAVPCTRGKSIDANAQNSGNVVGEVTRSLVRTSGPVSS